MRAELIDIENALETASPPASRTIRKADMLPRAAWVLIEIVMRESVLPLGGLWVSGRSAWARQGIVATSWITAGCIAGPSHTCSKDKHKTNDTYLRLDPTRRVGPASGAGGRGSPPVVGAFATSKHKVGASAIKFAETLKFSNQNVGSPCGLGRSWGNHLPRISPHWHWPTLQHGQKGGIVPHHAPTILAGGWGQGRDRQRCPQTEQDI